MIALQQHLGNAGGIAEITVDLERRMRIEEIVIDAAVDLTRGIGRGMAQSVVKHRMGVVAVERTRPQVDAPAERPSGGDVAAETKRIDGGFEIGAFGGYLSERIKTHKMRLVAVAVLTRLISARFPFAQNRSSCGYAVYLVTPCASIGLYGQTLVEAAVSVGKLRLEIIADAGVGAKHLDSLESRFKQIADNLLCMRRAVLGSGAMLGRPLCGGYKSAVRSLNKSLHPEFTAAHHYRHGFFAKEVTVESVAVMLPHMRSVPCVGDHIILGIV